MVLHITNIKHATAPDWLHKSSLPYPFSVQYRKQLWNDKENTEEVMECALAPSQAVKMLKDKFMDSFCWGVAFASCTGQLFSRHFHILVSQLLSKSCRVWACVDFWDAILTCLLQAFPQGNKHFIPLYTAQWTVKERRRMVGGTSKNVIRTHCRANQGFAYLLFEFKFCLTTCMLN